MSDIADVVALPYTPPYDRAALSTYLRSHLVPGIEDLSNGTYWRSLDVCDVRGIIGISLQARTDAIEVRLCLDDAASKGAAIARCRQLLDLDTDPATVASVLARDPLLAPLVAARPGLRVWGAFDGFELAVRAILGQQVSVAGACTLVSRLVARVGKPVQSCVGTVVRYFPIPEHLADADLSGLGITSGRIVALQTLAKSIARGDLSLERGADLVPTLEKLRSLPGIGPWTAQYVAMRAFGDLDAFPLADLGLRRALEALGEPVDPRSVADRAESWRPWRAYATHHLWSTLPAHRPQ